MKPEGSLVFTTAHHLSLFSANWIQSIPSYNIYDPFNIILPILPVSSKWSLLPSGFPTITHYVFLISPTHAPCPTSLIILEVIKLIVFGKDSLCTFL